MINAAPYETSPGASLKTEVLWAEVDALSRELEEAQERRVSLAREYRLLLNAAEGADAHWMSLCRARAQALAELESRIRQRGVKRILALSALRELRSTRAE